jgi:hypothetical protein
VRKLKIVELEGPHFLLQAGPVRAYLVLSIVYFLLSSIGTTMHVNSVEPNGQEFGQQDCSIAANARCTSRISFSFCWALAVSIAGLYALLHA